MKRSGKMKKGIVLIIVIGIFIVIATLSMSGLYLMTQQARFAEHQIKRMKALSKAKAGMVYALHKVHNDPDYEGGTINGITELEDVTVDVSDGSGDFSGLKKVEITVSY